MSENQNATPPHGATPAPSGGRVIPNPLDAVAPIVAVAVAGLAVVPLVAAERFAGGRPDRDEEPATAEPAVTDRMGLDAEPHDDAAGGTAVGAETAPVTESTSDEAAETEGSEPIAIESRQGSRRTGERRERGRDERGERSRSERPTRDERARRRSTSPELDPASKEDSSVSQSEVVSAASPAADAGRSIHLGSAEPDGNPGQPEKVAGELPAPAAGVGATVDTVAAPSGTIPAAARPPIELQQAEARRGVLVTPVIDTANQPPRAVERMRVQKEAAEKVILDLPEVTAAVAPLVRHVNNVTMQLNEAQITIGRLTAERDALRHQLLDETGALAEQIDQQMSVDLKDSERRQNRLLRQEAREGEPDDGDEPGRVSLFFRRAGLIIPDDAPEEAFKQAARKRQILAFTILSVVVLVIWLYQRGGQSIGNINRDSLAQIQGIGVIFQALLIAWMLYRVVRVGGKGARWLFPQQSQNTRRRKR